MYSMFVCVYIALRFLFKKLVMFERSGVAKKSVPGLLPGSILSSRSRPPVVRTVSHPVDTPTSNQRLTVGYAGPCASPDEAAVNGNKRSTGSLGKYGSRFKRQKLSETESGQIVVDSQGAGEDKGHRKDWKNKEGVGGGGGKEAGQGDKKSERKTSTLLNSSKDHSKLLMSESSENSEVEWNEDSDEGNGNSFLSPSNLKKKKKLKTQGRANVGKKKSKQSDLISKRGLDEEQEDEGGGEWV